MSTSNAEICGEQKCNSDDQTWCCPFYSLCSDLGECLGIKNEYWKLLTEATTSLLPRCPDKKECHSDSYSSYWCCSSGQICGTTIGTCQKLNTSRYIIGIILLIVIMLKWCSRSLQRRKANATIAIIPPAQNQGVETHAYSMTNMNYPASTVNPLEQSYIVLIPPTTTIPAATTEEDPPNYDLVTTKEQHPPTYDEVTSTARREQSEA